MWHSPERRGVRRRATAALVVALAVAGCYRPQMAAVDPRSEVATAVLQEYRRFVTRAEPELGPRQATAEGAIVATRRDPTQVEPKTPVAVERLGAATRRTVFWWESQIIAPLDSGKVLAEFEINELITRALARSNQISTFSDLPLIRDTAISEAEGAFDPVIFATGTADITENPVGNDLESGSSSRPATLREREFAARSGVRTPLVTGGEVTVSQRIGTKNSNSDFFNPDDQALSDIRLELRQPILERAGIAVNVAPIQIAQLDRNISVAELRRQIELQLVEIIRTYWTLYLERARVLQREKLAADLDGLARRLAARATLDILPGELEQARAAQANAQANVVRSRSAIRNAETRIATLLSDPSLMPQQGEIVPAQPPVRIFVDTPLEDVALLALQNRPEVHQAVQQLRSAEIRLGIAENRLQPRLDLVAAIANRGLDGDYDVGTSMERQFTRTDPELELAVLFEIPLYNTADRAVFSRRRLEVRQLGNQLRTISDSILQEAQVAVRESRTAFEEIQAREKTLLANTAQLDALRAQDVSGAGSGYAFLNTLLGAIEDRTTAEERYTEALVTYNLALYTLERVAGTLLSTRDIGATRVDDEILPYVAAVRGTAGLPVGEALSRDILRNPEATRPPGGRTLAP